MGIKESLRVGVATIFGVVVTLAVGPMTAFADRPPNILLLVADDLGWNDLPYFSEPIEWEALPATWADSESEARRHDAALNRFAARSYASATTKRRGFYHPDHLTPSRLTAVDWQFPTVLTESTAYLENTPCGGHLTPCTPNQNVCGSLQTAGKLPACTDARYDILPGFGGLARLAQSGIVFPRFYANSAKCAPSRAALFTGRYPARTGTAGVTLNGGELDGADVTIAEYLKQGCSASDPVELWCRTDGQPNTTDMNPATEATDPCPCYGTTDCADPLLDLACYRTGLVGKWHLGGKGNRAPWNQGFDEYFGFAGGSRYYWSTSDLDCSPAPKYCSGDNDEICESSNSCSAGTCGVRGLYLGTKRGSGAPGNPGDDRSSFNDCLFSPSGPDCCAPGAEFDETKRGSYKVSAHLADSDPTPGEGKDIFRTGARPCSDTGLTKDTDCAYSERILRDHARNFIVRNAPVEPWFLTLTFHAPHFAFGAPLRTEDHHKTHVDAGGVPDVPKSPNRATKYWAILEELDSAVGEILDVLDVTGVRDYDPSIPCTGGSDCLPLGIDGNGALCSTSTGCEPLRERTLVIFVSDQGRPGGSTDYGNPALRGGKGDVHEGGVRVGLLARYPGQKKGICANADAMKACNPDGSPTGCGAGEGPCIVPGVCSDSDNDEGNPVVPLTFCDPTQTSGQCTGANDGDCVELDVRVPTLASMVDLFPTIAEAAQYGSLLTEGRAKLEAAANGKTTDGRSFLWAFTDPTNPPSYARTRAYASYPGAGITVVTGEGDSVNNGSYKVCSYDSRISAQYPTASRHVRGASCENSACTTKWCKLPGRVCVDENAANPTCTEDGLCFDTPDNEKSYFDPASSTLSRKLLRCKRSNNECPTGLKCRADVYIKCSGEESNTLWKLMASSSGAPRELYELRSNSEEEDVMDCRGKGPDASNVLSNALNSSGGSGLGAWKACQSSDPAVCKDPPPP